MNGIFKGLFLFGLGAASGAYVAAKLLEDHYAAMAEEEIEATKEYARKKIKEIEARYENELVEPAEVKEESNNPYKKLVRDYNKPNLNDMVKEAGYTEPAEEEYPEDDYEDELTEDEETELEDRKLNTIEIDGPYLITEPEFASEKLHFDKVDLWYYKEDNTLANDEEDMIDDIAGLIGDDALAIFDNDDQTDTIYIRNEKLSADFQVTCLNKSYSVEVLGYGEEDNE